MTSNNTSGIDYYDLMNKYRTGLNYLTKTGLDVRFSDTQTWKGNLKDIVDRLGETSSVEKTGLLPIPYTIRKFTLSEKIMEVYKIKTKKDLAKYVRLVGIILSHFAGPDKYDHLDTFINRLKVILAELVYYTKQETTIIQVLKVYEQHTGTRITNHQILSEKDYISLVQILNAQYELYDANQKFNRDMLYLDNMTIERLGKMLHDKNDRKHLLKALIDQEVITPVSIDEFGQLVSTPDYRIKLLKKIKDFTREATGKDHGSLLNLFKLMYCGVTEETLLEQLKTKEHVKSLFTNLEYYLICPAKSEAELATYVNKPEKRAILLRIIQNFCKREFGE